MLLIQRNMFFTIKKEPANKRTKKENSLLQQTTKMFLKFVSNPKALAVSQMVSFQHFVFLKTYRKPISSRNSRLLKAYSLDLS